MTPFPIKRPPRPDSFKRLLGSANVPLRTAGSFYGASAPVKLENTNLYACAVLS